MAAPTQQQIDACASEPIRIPGGIQPHGAVLVLDPAGGTVLQHSANFTEIVGEPVEIGAPFALAGEVQAWLESAEPHFLQVSDLKSGAFNISGFRGAQGAILEFEAVQEGETESLEAVFPHLGRFADDILPLGELDQLGKAVADQVRQITGYARVMVYRFDVEWHGTVIAESSDGTLPSYLDLRFPASDIPAQARELYRLSTLRIIPDADYTPIPLVPVMSPVDGQPLDLSYCGLRSVSPVHLQYMRNMGTYASMSISIVVDGKLWGLISCHNATPRKVSPQLRAACNFIAKILSLQISAIERGRHAAERIALKRGETELVARLSRADAIAEELERNGTLWLGITKATGAAIITPDEVRRFGETPPKDALLRLAAFLEDRGEERLATDRLSSLWPEAASHADVASGLVAVPISQLHPSYVMWFRPEVIRTVTWGGDPRKSTDPLQQLSPRASFAQWREEVRERSIAWSDAEIESADDFRSAIINFVLRYAEERAELTEELERSNKELESFSYSVSHDLRAPFRHIVGYAELLASHDQTLDDKARHYVRNIIDSALSAGRLVDDLLSFSQLGRTSVEKTRVDMNKLVSEVRRTLEPDLVGRRVDWRIDQLPPAWGDASLLRQALANLIENAVKYSRDRDPAVIEITGDVADGHTRYLVRDNGVGFEMAYVQKLFGVFQRLHRAEDFPGTGIGLALAKRIVNRHGGQISAEGELDKGATFTFTLPRGGADTRHG